MRIHSGHALMVIAVAGATICACTGGQTVHGYAVHTGGSPQRGEQVIMKYRCGACHTIPGIRGANGVFAPPLTALGQTSYIGGVIPNTPENLVRWIQSPPSVKPKTAMPALGLSKQQARDAAAYLETLQ